MSSRATSSRSCRRRRALVTGAVLAATLLAACDSGSPEPSPPDPSNSTIPSPTPLTLGVYGGDEELAAYTAAAEAFDGTYDDAEVQVQTWNSSADLVAAMEESGEVPDVFLVSRDDLAEIEDQELTQPVDTLLDERGVDFGDGYSRDALQAFSSDDRLQCMPYGISPMVIYYNKDLVDFERMEARELPVPALDDDDRRPQWSFDNFAAAADFATRPRRGTRGVYIMPSVRDLSPFIYSGGGQVFDDEDDPTSLAFSDGDSRDALERSLELLRSPHVTLSEEQVAERSPLEWFKQGKLAMFAGYREHVPELRLVQGLDFDVIGMPILDGAATVGDITGLCLSADAANTPASADLMVHMLSTPAVERVVRTGYLVPANQEVALSEEFLQPGRLPSTSSVFNESVRSIVVPPLLSVWPELDAAVGPSLDELLTVEILEADDLDARLQEIDDLSQPILDPEEATPSEDDG